MLTTKLKNLFIYIGTHIKPIYPVLGVAAAQTVFKPLCTMMDKKSPEETKKYTALREGITEIVAAGTYFGCNKLGEMGAKLFKDPHVAERAKHNLGLLGIWTAALVVIPGICSLVVKPFTEKIYASKQKNPQNKLDTGSEQENHLLPKQNVAYTGSFLLNNTPNPISNYKLMNYSNTGMKVGL